MANPKHKISKARRDKRRAQRRLDPVGTGSCPQCHEPKLPHHTCLYCGTYAGRQVLPVVEQV
ncbi:MAG: 50S ribosomal protein L32 [Nitrospirae bacterium]|nr:50S ribosomal protein L32 [Nitrospirota bacterium]